MSLPSQIICALGQVTPRINDSHKANRLPELRLTVANKRTALPDPRPLSLRTVFERNVPHVILFYDPSRPAVPACIRFPNHLCVSAVLSSLVRPISGLGERRARVANAACR